MGDGPPWIQVEEMTYFPVGDELHRYPGYHLTLDEKHHWYTEIVADRPAGLNPELTIYFFKPQGGLFGPQNEAFMFWNDLYPEHAGPFPGCKFDNQDIYILGWYKDHPDPSVGWGGQLLPTNLDVDPTSNREWVHLGFWNGTTKVTVKITRQDRSKSGQSARRSTKQRKKRSILRPANLKKARSLKHS